MIMQSNLLSGGIE